MCVSHTLVQIFLSMQLESNTQIIGFFRLWQIFILYDHPPLNQWEKFSLTEKLHWSLVSYMIKTNGFDKTGNIYIVNFSENWQVDFCCNEYT